MDRILVYRNGQYGASPSLVYWKLKCLITISIAPQLLRYLMDIAINASEAHSKFLKVKPLLK